jgi:hypothetical protein
VTLLRVRNITKCEAPNEFNSSLVCRTLWEFYTRTRSGQDVFVRSDWLICPSHVSGEECEWSGHKLLGRYQVSILVCW